MTKPIDINEKFPHLTKAPIVEAVLAINVSLSEQWDETTLQNVLKERLPDFPKIEPLRMASHKFTVGKSDYHETQDLVVGIKLESNSNPHIVQFNKDAFVFSRLEPYSDWKQFSHEALRLWEVYYELLKPADVGRIGLRFVNRIKIKQDTIKLDDYYQYPPQSIKELNWPLSGYLHHDVMLVPDTKYAVNLIKTVQPDPGEIGLILDIDVFRQEPFVYNEPRFVEYLEEMRWVKNKIFFGSLTTGIIKDLE